MDDKIEFIHIDTDETLDDLVGKIQKRHAFAEAFKFGTDELKERLFTALGISEEKYIKEYYFYDKQNKLHISDSERGYTWISTIGLVANRNPVYSNDNRFYNAYRYQYIVLSLLIEKAISLCEDKRTFDIDGYNYGYLNEFTPALFHNIAFYYEILGKTYLFISNVRFRKTHKLSKILEMVKETMWKLNHNDTLFNAHTIPYFEHIVKHINRIPRGFEEYNIKYDDNPGDTTTLRFDIDDWNGMRNIINICNDIICDYFYFRESSAYFKPGLFNRLFEKAKTEDDKKWIIEEKSFLIKRT